MLVWFTMNFLAIKIWLRHQLFKSCHSLASAHSTGVSHYTNWAVFCCCWFFLPGLRHPASNIVMIGVFLVTFYYKCVKIRNVASAAALGVKRSLSTGQSCARCCCTDTTALILLDGGEVVLTSCRSPEHHSAAQSTDSCFMSVTSARVCTMLSDRCKTDVPTSLNSSHMAEFINGR